MNLAEYQEIIKEHRIPDTLPEIVRDNYGWGDDTIRSYETRIELNKRGCWVFIALDWVKPLADFIGARKCLEVMAGGGWLAAALAHHGVDIIATDDKSWEELRKGQIIHSMVVPIHPILQYNATRAIKKFSDAEILLVSWPPYQGRAINYALDAWGSRRPVIYIGEGEGGCTANDAFFRHFKVDETINTRLPLPSFSGIHDDIMIGYWRRTKP